MTRYYPSMLASVAARMRPRGRLAAHMRLGGKSGLAPVCAEIAKLRLEIAELKASPFAPLQPGEERLKARAENRRKRQEEIAAARKAHEDFLAKKAAGEAKKEQEYVEWRAAQDKRNRQKNKAYEAARYQKRKAAARAAKQQIGSSTDLTGTGDPS